MENLPTLANENAASVYRHEPRSLEFFNEQSDSGCNCTGCNCRNSNGSAAELLFLLSLWGFMSQMRQRSNSAAEQRASEQSEEPSC
ncbi:MAG: hypothetical protein K2K60_07285 [Clostridia bacterium]|nr:hypothetical protein [Clostridia bacterium]